MRSTTISTPGFTSIRSGCVSGKVIGRAAGIWRVGMLLVELGANPTFSIRLTLGTTARPPADSMDSRHCCVHSDRDRSRAPATSRKKRRAPALCSGVAQRIERASLCLRHVPQRGRTVRNPNGSGVVRAREHGPMQVPSPGPGGPAPVRREGRERVAVAIEEVRRCAIVSASHMNDPLVVDVLLEKSRTELEERGVRDAVVLEDYGVRDLLKTASRVSSTLASQP